MRDNYTTAFAEGRDAFHDNAPMKDCPYDSRLDESSHRAWCRGYVEAEIETYAMS